MNSMSRVLSNLLILLIFLSGLASLPVPAVAGISVRLVHCPQAARTLSFNYDWRIRTHLDYDRHSKEASGYDGTAVLATSENLDQLTGDRARFVNSAEFLAAETAPSIEAQLQTHLDNAIARFAQEGFTPNQAAALVKNPNLEAAFRGTQIDTFFKESVSADANLSNLQITPRIRFGPDVFDPANKVWYDVTTPAQWQSHVLKYNPGFGQGVPLFH